MIRATWTAMALACVVLGGCKPKEAPKPSKGDARVAPTVVPQPDKVPPSPAKAATSAEPAPRAPVAKGATPTAGAAASPAPAAKGAPSKAARAAATAPKQGPVAGKPSGAEKPAKDEAKKPAEDDSAVYKMRSKRAAKHPLAKARKHQYVLYRVGDMLQRQTVVRVTPTRVAIRFQTILKGRDVSDSTTETDLEAISPHRPGAKKPEITHLGKRVVSVFGRRVVCEVTERKRLDGSTARTWRSDDVPLWGIVKVERIHDGKTTVVRELIDFGDFWGPDHSR